LKRADVVQAFRGKYEILHDRVGFLVYVSEVYQRDESIYAEIEMRDGRIAFRPIEPGFLSGLQAITELLSQVELRGEDIVFGLGNVIGPAIAAMNTSRLQSRPEKTILQYGVPLNNPRATIIIPLYGRVDFLEYQIAFFSHGLADDHEIIYVLDDPERRAETEAIAKSCFAKFERPFALICLSHNVGYAPANNIGLSHARGDYICYLNSDVFPDNPDWLELLIATEESSESIGIVGAQLLYEDGTLQHRGCVFERDAEIGDLYLVHHPDKGRRVALPQSQAAAPAITGACMLMKRELALRLGGFDENYVIGDFEDADLCLRARELGQICVVDYRARLFHLERQSQGQSQPWRRNLTLYNAWRFQQRWNNHEL
jgi:GT2 family glycosyltransferase